MKFTLLIASGAVLLFGATGCAKSGSNVVGTSFLRSGGDWSVASETAECEAVVPAYCQGAYGFAIRVDGSWTAGPSPANAMASGTLTGDELNTLAADINALAANTPGSCTSVANHTSGAPTIPGVRSVIALSTSNGRQLEVGGPGDLLSSACRGSQASLAMWSEFQTLLGKYYPRPLGE